MDFLLEISLAGALLVALITIIRALAMHKLPKRTFLMLWGIVLVRLLVPVSVPAQTSVFNLRDVFEMWRVSEPYVAVHHMEGMQFPALEDLPTGSQPYPVTVDAGRVNAEEVVLVADDSGWLASVAPLVLAYFAGLIALAIYFAVALVRQLRHFAPSLPVRNDFIDDWLDAHRLKRRIRVRVLDTIDMPLTYGIFRPVILLPKDMDWDNEDELKYVLSHEYVHIRRFDALTKLVVAAALCFHWFNPLVWVMYILLNRDMEISCDEAVVNMHGSDKSSRQGYALALIGMMERQTHISVLHSNFSKHSIEERINAIVKMKKGTISGTLVSLLIVFTSATVFATNSVDRSDWERRFHAEYNPFFIQEELRAGSISMDEAAQIGGDALELLFGADLSGITIHMSYRHGSDVSEWTEIVENWADELGTTLSELTELLQWPHDWDNSQSMPLLEFYSSRGLDVMADRVGEDVWEFVHAIRSANTVSTPSMWFALIMPENDFSANEMFGFTVNAETGELQVATYTPNAAEVQAARAAQPNEALGYDYQYAAFHSELFDEVQVTLNALLEEIPLDEQHNYKYANLATEVMRTLDMEAARAKIQFHMVGRDVFLEPVEIVYVMAQCVNGNNVELGFQRYLHEEEIVLTFVRFATAGFMPTDLFDWVELL